jgi:glycosyltransferase involved in cell wall biosynthesis
LKNAIKEVDAFIAPSKFGKLVHQPWMPEASIVHLPSFVPQDPPSDDSRLEQTDRPYFLFVGRLEKLKGLQTLIPIFYEFDRADLVIAGRGSYESRLRGMAAGRAGIKFLGQCDDNQLQMLYRNAAAVIVPSICFEMFPLVILEAFRHGTPVVARNLGGIPEIIEESGGGLTYETEQELLPILHRFVADPQFRHELGSRGYAAFESNWTVEAHLQKYFKLISSISNSGKD